MMRCFTVLILALAAQGLFGQTFSADMKAHANEAARLGPAFLSGDSQVSAKAAYADVVAGKYKDRWLQVGILPFEIQHNDKGQYTYFGYVLTDLSYLKSQVIVLVSAEMIPKARRLHKIFAFVNYDHTEPMTLTDGDTGEQTTVQVPVCWTVSGIGVN